MNAEESVKGVKTLLGVAAVLEAVTGLALIIHPVGVVHALFGTDISGAGLPLGRVGGIGLLSLGLACWPVGGYTTAALRAMFVYNLMAAAYLAWLWFDGQLIGKLLLPAVALHGVFTLLLLRAWLKFSRN